MADAGSRRPVGNLPGDVTRFVGRRRETVQVKRLLRRARLLTLTGVAGVGKTRLALRAAAQVREVFPDGVWLVELVALTEDRLLAPSLAEALGIQDQHGQRSAMDMLADYLRDKQLLLVLDNCEHLLDSCAVLASELLGKARGLRILATSRHALRADGEHLIEVPPLSVPDLRQPMTTRAIARHDAVRLFAERAALALPGFTVDAGNRTTIARICQRLDGIPLAIELAALRVRALSVHEILTGLDDYLEFLAVGSRIAVPRLQTLRAAIDWSFALCSGPEQQLWARASVFADGFDLEAAEAVCGGQGIAREDVLDLVATLVDKSVLTRTPTRTNDNTPARYRMLEAIRQYGGERLASSGHRVAVRTRHRDHYRWLVTRAEQEWLGLNELAWFTRLRQEQPNLRVALEFCLLEPGEERAGLEIPASLWIYWIRSCSVREGRLWLDRALLLAPEPSPQRAKALWASSWLTLLQADMATGWSRLKQARVLAQQIGDESTLANTTMGFGLAAFVQHDLHRAATLLEDALAHHHALGDPAGVFTALRYLTMATALGGDPDRAVAFGQEGLALCDTRGAYSSRLYPLWGLGLGRWYSGDRREASRLIREGIPAAQQFGDRWVLAHCIEVLAWIADADGRHGRAARLLGVAHTVWRSTGTPPSGPKYLNPCHERCEQAVRTALGNEEFTAAFQHGMRFTLEQAIGYVLDATSERTTTVPSAPAPADLSATLTRRERQVAELAGQGLSNNGIAVKLLIAQRAAEGHLQRILAKLGLTERAQLAVWIIEHPQPSEDQ
jgi:predicted ATPase/DNA-binding CsgD family transcriptional regulator